MGSMRHTAALWTVPVGLAVVFCTFPIWEQDLFWQLRAGEELRVSRTFPHLEAWSYTSQGSAWLNVQWLATLLLRYAHLLTCSGPAHFGPLILVRVAYVAALLAQVGSLVRTLAAEHAHVALGGAGGVVPWLVVPGGWRAARTAEEARRSALLATPLACASRSLLCLVCAQALVFFASKHRLQLRSETLCFHAFVAIWQAWLAPGGRPGRKPLLAIGCVVLSGQLHSGVSPFAVGAAIGCVLALPQAPRAVGHRLAWAVLTVASFLVTPYHYRVIRILWIHLRYATYNRLTNPDHETLDAKHWEEGWPYACAALVGGAALGGLGALLAPARRGAAAWAGVDEPPSKGTDAPLATGKPPKKGGAKAAAAGSPQRVADAARPAGGADAGALAGPREPCFASHPILLAALGVLVAMTVDRVRCAPYAALFAVPFAAQALFWLHDLAASALCAACGRAGGALGSVLRRVPAPSVRVPAALRGLLGGEGGGAPSATPGAAADHGAGLLYGAAAAAALAAALAVGLAMIELSHLRTDAPPRADVLWPAPPAAAPPPRGSAQRAPSESNVDFLPNVLAFPPPAAPSTAAAAAGEGADDGLSRAERARRRARRVLDFTLELEAQIKPDHVPRLCAEEMLDHPLSLGELLALPLRHHLPWQDSSSGQTLDAPSAPPRPFCLRYRLPRLGSFLRWAARVQRYVGGRGLSEASFPMGCVDFLRTVSGLPAAGGNLSAANSAASFRASRSRPAFVKPNIYHGFTYGHYLTWNNPEYPVFCDTREVMFHWLQPYIKAAFASPAATRENTERWGCHANLAPMPKTEYIAQMGGWRDLLAEYSPRERWGLVCFDHISILNVARAPKEHAKILREHEYAVLRPHLPPTQIPFRTRPPGEEHEPAELDERFHEELRRCRRERPLHAWCRAAESAWVRRWHANDRTLVGEALIRLIELPPTFVLAHQRGWAHEELTQIFRRVRQLLLQDAGADDAGAGRGGAAAGSSLPRHRGR